MATPPAPVRWRVVHRRVFIRNAPSTSAGCTSVPANAVRRRRRAANCVAPARLDAARELRGPLQGDVPPCLVAARSRSHEAALEGEHCDESRAAGAQHGAVRQEAALASGRPTRIDDDVGLEPATQEGSQVALQARSAVSIPATLERDAVPAAGGNAVDATQRELIDPSRLALVPART